MNARKLEGEGVKYGHSQSAPGGGSKGGCGRCLRPGGGGARSLGRGGGAAYPPTCRTRDKLYVLQLYVFSQANDQSRMGLGQDFMCLSEVAAAKRHQARDACTLPWQ